MLFDAPSREVCVVKRSRTNTPLQALALLNEVTYVEAARKLAEQMIAAGETSKNRVSAGFRMATGRTPTEPELDVLTDGLQVDLVRFRQNPDAALKLLGVGEAKPSTNIDAAELAAYTLTANVLLNLDEVVTRE